MINALHAFQSWLAGSPWESLPLHIHILISGLVFLGGSFLIFFVVPGIVLRGKFNGLVRDLWRLDGVDIDVLTKLFSRDRGLSHLWQEYRETLHEQRALNPTSGDQELIAHRSTVPAEAFFNTQVLVDSRLRTEFFKHVPGIFTGIGIIGTFYGLILGLQAFEVSESPSVVRNSLNLLLHSVGEAFLVSACAIGAAMLVTLFEKLLLSSLYIRVQRIAQSLDGFFEAGAGEEYLSRLVTASEDSSAQTRILKDALVADLKELLTELTDKQIAASTAGNQQLGEQIVGSLQNGLQAPLDKIANAVGQVSQDQGSAVNRLLTDVLSGFHQQMKELFGDQIGGINRMQQQTIEALQGAVGTLKQMVENVESAGKSATDAMATRLTDAISAMESRQQELNAQMAAFVTQIGSSIDQSQSESNEKVQVMLAALGDQVSEMVRALQDQVAQTAAASGEREARVADRAEGVVSQFGTQVDEVLLGVSNAMAEMQGAVRVIQGTTTDSVAKMNSSAETLHLAASEFAKAGQGVSSALNQAEGISDRLARAADSVSGATQSLAGVLDDYRAARDSVSKLLEVLETTVESARSEVALTENIMKRMEGAATKLAQAQQQADHYLASVSSVLSDAHSEFAANMKKSLGDANTQFYSSLSDATGLLRDAITELSVTVDAIPVGTSGR